MKSITLFLLLFASLYPQTIEWSSEFSIDEYQYHEAVHAKNVIPIINKLYYYNKQPSFQLTPVWHESVFVAKHDYLAIVDSFFPLLYPSAFFEIEKSKVTILDGKMWQDEPYTKQEFTSQPRNISTRKVLTHLDALSYCEHLSILGYKDWRLPSIQELHRLYLNNRLRNTNTKMYWSSNASSEDFTKALGYGFEFGSIVEIKKEKVNFVRCVRDN